MLKVRLMRIGTKNRPFYRVVVVDERKKRTGGYVELVGTYNPLTEPKDINLKKDRLEHWQKQGAQLSDGVLRILGKAPQKPPRKAKREKAEKAPEAAKEEAAEPAPDQSEPVEAETPEASESVSPEEATETTEETQPEAEPQTTEQPSEEATTS